MTSAALARQRWRTVDVAVVVMVALACTACGIALGLGLRREQAAEGPSSLRVATPTRSDAPSKDAAPERAPYCPPPAPPTRCPDVAPVVARLTKAEIVRQAEAEWTYETPFADDAGRALPGGWKLPDGLIDWGDDAQLVLWEKLRALASDFRSGCPCLVDTMYPRLDAFVLWAILRALQPTRVLEVGSGVSTRVAGFALLQNQRETAFAADVSLTCIEPYRTSAVDGLKFPFLNVIAKPVQQVDFDATFGQLRAGDVLFLDTSHVLRPFGDVVYELIFVLPRLPPGVIVHIHDIFLPYDYPVEWMDREQRVYTEQWLVAALLQSGRVRVLWSTHRHVRDRYAEVVAPILTAAFGQSGPDGTMDQLDMLASSLWLQTV